MIFVHGVNQSRSFGRRIVLFLPMNKTVWSATLFINMQILYTFVLLSFFLFGIFDPLQRWRWFLLMYLGERYRNTCWFIFIFSFRQMKRGRWMIRILKNIAFVAVLTINTFKSYCARYKMLLALKILRNRWSRMFKPALILSRHIFFSNIHILSPYMCCCSSFCSAGEKKKVITFLSSMAFVVKSRLANSC
jgi:hypothetical protein